MRVKTITTADLVPQDAPGDGWHIIEAAGEHPKRIPLPGGKSLTITQHLTPEVLAGIVAAGLPEGGLLIDRDHFAEDPDKPTEAMGWVRELALCGDESASPRWLAARIEWTPLGRPLIEGRIYRYFSTVYPSLPADTPQGAVCTPTRLIGLALTNKPNNHHGQPPITNRELATPQEHTNTDQDRAETQDEHAERAALCGTAGVPNRESEAHSVGYHRRPTEQAHAGTQFPDLRQNTLRVPAGEPATARVTPSRLSTRNAARGETKTMNAEILKLLGLPEDASEEEAIAAISALKEGEKKAALAEADAVINSEAKAAGAELSDEEREECRELLLTNRDTGMKYTSLLCRSKAAAPAPQVEEAPAPVQNRLYGGPEERPALNVTNRSTEDSERIAIHNRANAICQESRARGVFKGYHTALAEAERESRK